MRLVRLICLAVICLRPTCKVGYAAPPHRAPNEKDAETASNAGADAHRIRPVVGGEERLRGKPLDKPRIGSEHMVKSKTHERRPVGLAAANHPKGPTNYNSEFFSAGATGLHHSSENAILMSKDGSIESATVHSTLTIHPPSICGPAPPALSDMRHRGANPSVVTGLVHPKSSAAAAIDGRAVPRKP